MSNVTIEGTLTPAAGVLARGDRKTVAYTPRIDRLVKGGFVKIVEVHDDEDPVQTEPDETLSTPPVGPEEPKRNASREEWAAFLTASGMDFHPDSNRDQLIGVWDDTQDVTPDPVSDGTD